MDKRALCIGINDYPGTGSDLAGCVNDANDWAEALAGRGFEVAVMLDAAATREAMLDDMGKLVSAADSGDVVVITYSGHGTWVPDTDGDEKDLRDEALCPHDLRAAGAITDDALFELFSARKRGVRAVLVSDSCHSGTLQRLAPPIGDNPVRVRFLAPEVFLPADQRALAERASVAERAGRPRRSALVLAGCRDTEYSYDASFGDRPNGAFSYVALQALRQLPAGATYRDWVTKIREQLPSADYPQTPQLDGTSSQRRWAALA
jgi:hypothetical protein